MDEPRLTAMTSKEIVMKKYPDAEVCCGDDPESRIIMRPGQCLSDEFPPHEWDEDGAENDAWQDAAWKIEDAEESNHG